MFISYSRRDIVFARALEKALEDYSPPGDLAVPQRHLVVFRDEEDFTGVEYNNSVREHLKNSAKMLVICSPHARASKFVSDEIRLFAEMRGAENIIPVLLSGIPNNEARQPEHEELKAFPKCLLEVMPMPLAPSFIGLDPVQDKLYEGVFIVPWYTVLANIYGVSRVDIQQHERKRKTFDYDVFISYSRRDIVFARALEKALEDYSPPRDLAVPQRHLVVFRDEEDLTGVEYNRSIREHLENSAKMLVICSPHARASDFVSDEIRHFAEKRGGQNIIPVLLSGIPNNEAKKPEHEELKAFPRCLREVMETPLAAKPSETMPLAADFIDLDPAKDKLYKGVFKGPWYTVLANIYGVPRSDIEQRDRTRKTRQRRVTATLVAGIIAVLTGALILAHIQRKEAVSQRELAEKARDDAEGLIQFMLFDLQNKLLPIGRIGIMDSVNQRVDEYNKSLITDNLGPESMRRQSAILISNGYVLVAKGRLDDALAAFTAGKDICEKLSAKDPSNTQWVIDLAVSYTNVGDVLMKKGQTDDALAAFTACKDICEKLSAQDPTNTELASSLAISYLGIGDVLIKKGQIDDALAAFTASKDIAEKLSAQDPSNTQWVHGLSVSHDNVGDVLMEKGRLDDALAAFTAGKDIREILSAQDSSNTQWARDLSVSHEQIGDVNREKHSLIGACVAYEKAIQIAWELAARDPGSTDWAKILRYNLQQQAEASKELGETLKHQGQEQEARSSFEASSTINGLITKLDPADPQWQYDFSVSRISFGDFFAATEHFDAAAAAYQVSKEIAERLAERYPNSNEWQYILATALRREADIAFAQAQRTETAAAMDRAANIYARLAETLNTPEARSESAEAWGALAWYLLFDNQPQEAIEAARKGLETDPSKVWINTNLAHGHLFCGRYVEAEQIYRDNCEVALFDGRRFDQAVLNDFKEMRDKGITHPDMEKIEKLLTSRR